MKGDSLKHPVLPRKRWEGFRFANRLFFLVLLPWQGGHAQLDWITPVVVDSSFTGSQALVSSFSPDDIAVAFYGREGASDVHNVIYYSTDGGTSFTKRFPPPPVSSGAYIGPPESLGFDRDGNLLELTSYHADPLTETTIIWKSTDRGITFLSFWSRSDFSSSLSANRSMQITPDNNVSLIRDTASFSYPYPDLMIYTKLDAEGKQTDAVFPQMDDSAAVASARFLVVGDTVHVIMTLLPRTGNEYRMYYSRSTDGGTDFSAFLLVHDSLAINPILARTTSGLLYAIYRSGEQGSGNSSFLHAVEIADSCICFSSSFRIGAVPGYPSMNEPRFSSDSSGNYLAYYGLDALRGNGVVYYRFDDLRQPPTDSSFFPRMRGPHIVTDGKGGKYMVMDNDDDFMIYFTKKDVHSSVGGQSVIPERSVLHQSYPNPFNSISSFGFRISDVGLVRLDIYDLLGREVATIVNERLSPGTYMRSWDAAGEPSGVYFYRLQAGSYVETKKLVLLR